jgi:hypothetical protein
LHQAPDVIRSEVGDVILLDLLGLVPGRPKVGEQATGALEVGRVVELPPVPVSIKTSRSPVFTR